MKKPKKRNRARVQQRKDTIKSLEGLLKQIVPDFSIRLGQAERRAVVAEEALGLLKKRLTQLLSPDQLEAARVCGCSPEVYAIECIEIWKGKVFPSFPNNIRPLHGLQGDSIT